MPPRFILLLLIVAVPESVDGVSVERAKRANMLLRHQNIVMTLHGLMDHIDLDELDAKGNLRINELPATGYTAMQLFADLDSDHDGRVSLTELAIRIQATVRSHLERESASAVSEYLNHRGPLGIDWEGILGILAADHRAELLRSGVERDKVAFSLADGDGDGFLSEAEYVLFRNPELAPKVLALFAEKFVEQSDEDRDGKINATEFLNVELRIKSEGNNSNSVQAYEHRAEHAELSREFQEFDLDSDGWLQHNEIALLFSADHRSHAINEAYTLTMAADTNGDHELSPVELTSAFENFDQSRWLNYHDRGKRVHIDLESMYDELQSSFVKYAAAKTRDEL